ncbi:MAG: TIGR02996 domain-containing protein [Aureliella sp.]
MLDDNPFAEEVRTHPHDDTPRLIFADFLEDSGNPQGEFIRVQVSLGQLLKNDPARTQLELRERELIEAYGEQWLEPLRELGAEGVSTRCFQRGLIERIRISARNFLQHGQAICSASPALHAIQITRLDEAFDGFSNASLPEQIRWLDLTGSNVAAIGGSQQWFQMRCIEQVTELSLQFGKVEDDDLTGLCDRDLSGLRKLHLGANAITAAGAYTLANCTSLHNLHSLLLPLNAIGPTGARAVGRSPFLVQLVELDLASNAIGNEGAKGLADSISLSSLQRLNLRANQITSSTYETMAGYPALKNLRELDVRNNRFPQR